MNETITDMLSDRGKYPHIPKNLIKHVEILTLKGCENRLIRTLVEFPELTIKAINGMFELAMLATGLDADELLRRTDFHPNDINEIRAEAAFAEIRSINFLYSEGFRNIDPIRGSRNPSADILASRDGIPYVVEVTLSIYQPQNVRFTRADLRNWLIERFIASCKRTQLSASAASLSNARRLLIGVVDTKNVVALQTHEEFCAAVKGTWEALQASGEDVTSLHICLMSGREALGVGRDDCIFPGWPIASTKEYH